MPNHPTPNPKKKRKKRSTASNLKNTMPNPIKKKKKKSTASKVFLYQEPYLKKISVKKLAEMESKKKQEVVILFIFSCL